MPEHDDATTLADNVKGAGAKLDSFVAKFTPNYRNADEVAYALAKTTPRTLIMCFALLLAGMVASRLNLWAENFLWGIPSIGALSLGLGVWVWSTNLLLRPDLSDEARAVLKRAIRLQWSLPTMLLVAVVYFGGMAAGWW